MKPVLALLALTFLCHHSVLLSGENWPNFRGPNGDGISPDTNLLDEWPEGGPAKRWVYDNAGMGYSGFSVVDGRLYTMGTRGDEVNVICIDVASGSEVWSVAIGEDDQEAYKTGWGHGPRSTPTISDGLLYAVGPAGSLVCLETATGKSVWSAHMVDDFDGKLGGWGFASSPLIDGDRLVVAPGGNESGMVALDKKTGRVVWKATDVRPGKAEYATIVSAEINGVPQYIKLFEKLLVGVAADDGRLLWESPWNGKVAVIPTPIVDGNQVYIATGYGIGCKLVEINEAFEASDVWVNKTMKNHHGGVIKSVDYLYGFSDGAGLICQSWETGKLVWNEKGQFTSKGAVHVADGNLYALNEGDGTLSLAALSPDGFELKGRFQLSPQSSNRSPKGKIWTHPLVLNGMLFLRDQEFIVCYDVSGN